MTYTIQNYNTLVNSTGIYLYHDEKTSKSECARHFHGHTHYTTETVWPSNGNDACSFTSNASSATPFTAAARIFQEHKTTQKQTSTKCSTQNKCKIK